jgi:hypothetical protein
MIRNRIMTTVTSVLLLGTLGITGCGTSSSTTNTTSGPSNHQVSKEAKYLTSAKSNLKSQSNPKIEGVATMTLDSRSHTLTIVAEVSGLMPGAKYKATIENSKTNKTIYTLQTVKADKTGSALFHNDEKDVKALPPSGSEIVVFARADTKAQGPVVTGEIVQVKK